MTNQELKPCPFCGGKAILEPYRNGWSVNHVCMMIDPVWFPAKQEAIERWNARSGDACKVMADEPEMLSAVHNWYLTCGHEVYTFDRWAKPNYCVQCGARVEED